MYAAKFKASKNEKMMTFLEDVNFSNLSVFLPRAFLQGRRVMYAAKLKHRKTIKKYCIFG